MKSIWKKLSLLLSLAWSISPRYILMLVLSTLISSGQIMLNVMLPKLLIDELMGLQRAGMLLLYGGLIVGANVLFTLLGNATRRYLAHKDFYVGEMMQERMAEKIMNVEYAYLETPYYLDLKERAAFAIANQGALVNFIRSFADLLKHLITSISLIALLFTLGPVLIVAVLCVIAVGVLMFANLMRKQLVFYQAIVPTNRRYGYYVNSAYDEKNQKDIRLYDMSGIMNDKIGMFNLKMMTEFKKYYQYQGRVMGAYGVLNDLQTALAYGFVGVRTFTTWLGPRLSIGSFTMYVNAVINFSRSAFALTESVAMLWQFMGYLEPFVEFMQLPNEAEKGGHTPMDGAIEEIRFDNVSFAYPGSDTLVLKDVSFTIHRGEKISVVGLNGAGKTTLVKLISRLYRPTSGTIYLNGRDIFDYDHEQYMREISAVFQDYKLLAYSVDENITGKAPGSDDARVNSILTQVGLKAKMDSLPHGKETLLGKAYNEEGTEFSGGEQQKVAIARALYKDGSLIILDEPTSALDPLAEAEIYENFNALIGDKTAIYISHRMSSSVFCDRILLLNHGTVEDFDTHAALMQKTDSLYYKLFTSQAENYRIEAEIQALGMV